MRTGFFGLRIANRAPIAGAFLLTPSRLRHDVAGTLNSWMMRKSFRFAGIALNEIGF